MVMRRDFSYTIKVSRPLQDGTRIGYVGRMTIATTHATTRLPHEGNPTPLSMYSIMCFASVIPQHQCSQLCVYVSCVLAHN